MPTPPADVGPPLVRCTECDRDKCPWGRDAPAGENLCNFDCTGYDCDPIPRSLWPGETREEFGYGG